MGDFEGLTFPKENKMIDLGVLCYDLVSDPVWGSFSHDEVIENTKKYVSSYEQKKELIEEKVLSFFKNNGEVFDKSFLFGSKRKYFLNGSFFEQIVCSNSGYSFVYEVERNVINNKINNMKLNIYCFNDKSCVYDLEEKVTNYLLKQN